MIKTFADGTMAEENGIIYEVKGPCRCDSCSFGIVEDKICKLIHTDFDCSGSHFEPMNVGLIGWRSKITYVGLFDGIWYQLVPSGNANCFECDLYKNGTHIKLFLCIKSGCYPERHGGILNSWGVWKEIGDK